MIYDYHILFAVTSIFFQIFSYGPYLRDIFRGTTKPHPFTWLIWGLINVIAFFAQLAEGGGAGAWVTAIVATTCLFVAVLAFMRGERHIVTIDWICFFGALAGIVLWRVTDNPFLAILLVTLTDALAFVPTFRKTFFKPNEETASAWIIGAIGFLFQIVAFETLNLTTVLYPAFIAAANTSLVAMILIRRRQLKA